MYIRRKKNKHFCLKTVWNGIFFLLPVRIQAESPAQRPGRHAAPRGWGLRAAGAGGTVLCASSGPGGLASLL